MTRVVKAECPWCGRGPLPTQPGPQVCSKCSMVFQALEDTGTGDPMTRDEALDHGPNYECEYCNE